jgi:hypothetical protein
MRSLVALSTAALAIAGLGALSACGDAPPRSAERFCGELAAHLDEIHTPPTTPDGIPALILLYSKMGEVAPLDVQRDWETVYGILKTADTVDVNDPASVQAVANAAYAAQNSAESVAAWAKSNCAIDVGPIGSVPGGVEVAPPPVDSTTTGSG